MNTTVLSFVLFLIIIQTIYTDGAACPCLDCFNMTIEQEKYYKEGYSCPINALISLKSLTVATTNGFNVQAKIVDINNNTLFDSTGLCTTADDEFASAWASSFTFYLTCDWFHFSGCALQYKVDHECNYPACTGTPPTCADSVINGVGYCCPSGGHIHASGMTASQIFCTQAQVCSTSAPTTLIPTTLLPTSTNPTTQSPTSTLNPSYPTWTGTYLADSTCSMSQCCCLTGNVAVSKVSNTQLLLSSDVSGDCGDTHHLDIPFTNSNSFEFETTVLNNNYRLSLDKTSTYVTVQDLSAPVCSGNAKKVSPTVAPTVAAGGGNSIPMWQIVVIVIAVVFVLGAALLYGYNYYTKKQQQKQQNIQLDYHAALSDPLVKQEKN